MASEHHQLAVVTGASTGIGYELAKVCARNGFDLIVAADEPRIHESARTFEGLGVKTIAVEGDLATTEGVDRLYAAIRQDGRPVGALLANAGRGLGRGFLEQDFGDIRRVVDTNVTGTLYLLQKVGRDMVAAKQGKILITGSIAGFMPGTFQAVYNGSKAFLDSFSYAAEARAEQDEDHRDLSDAGCDGYGVFERADMMDTKVGTAKKDDPADVAKQGYAAMKNGDGQVITGWKNKLQATIAHVAPSDALAEMHRSMAEPGTAA